MRIFLSRVDSAPLKRLYHAVLLEGIFVDEVVKMIVIEASGSTMVRQEPRFVLLSFLSTA